MTTRILQIRRGNSTQNDNFTGLSGEITFDTTAKTLRVHDGETLGGFALARADAINTFDINSVSASFWTALFSTYQTNQIQTESSNLLSITNSAFIDYEFTYTQMPLFVKTVLVCQNPEAGYSIDDEVSVFGIGNYLNPKTYDYVSSGHLHSRIFVGEQSFWVFHKTDATKTNITNSNWKIKFTVYY